jgi:hypothetical protein
VKAISDHRTSSKLKQLIKPLVIEKEWRHGLELDTVQLRVPGSCTRACLTKLLTCKGYCISHRQHRNDYLRQLGGGGGGSTWTV